MENVVLVTPDNISELIKAGFDNEFIGLRQEIDQYNSGIYFGHHGSGEKSGFNLTLLIPGSYNADNYGAGVSLWVWAPSDKPGAMFGEEINSYHFPGVLTPGKANELFAFVLNQGIDKALIEFDGTIQ